MWGWPNQKSRLLVLTVATWLIADRALCFADSYTRQSTAECAKSLLKELTPEEILAILKEICEADFAYVTDVYQLVNASTSQLFEELLVKKAKEREAAILVTHGLSIDEFYSILRSCTKDEVCLACEQIKLMIHTALHGNRYPVMPSVLGYPEELDQDSRDTYLEVVAGLNRLFRSRIVECVKEWHTQNKDADIDWLPDSTSGGAEFSPPTELAKVIKGDLQVVQHDELSRLGINATRYLHAVALLHNDPSTHSHMDLLQSTHLQQLVTQLVQVKLDMNAIADELYTPDEDLLEESAPSIVD